MRLPDLPGLCTLTPTVGLCSPLETWSQGAHDRHRAQHHTPRGSQTSPARGRPAVFIETRQQPGHVYSNSTQDSFKTILRPKITQVVDASLQKGHKMQKICLKLQVQLILTVFVFGYFTNKPQKNLLEDDARISQLLSHWIEKIYQPVKQL